MQRKVSSVFAVAALASSALWLVPALSQTLLDRSVLPIRTPTPPVITELDASKVKAPTPFSVTAPAGAPNVLVILLDDFGYGDPSTFGGPIPMATADRLAAEGLRYTRFHTTAMCAPTRAALLTGRNHHSVNMGTITEMSTSMPGYTGQRPQDVATLAETLKLNGYNTAHFGKTHEVPTWEYSVVGNYENWPTQSGMEYFYGFFGGETDQWNPPNLYEGQAKIPTPEKPGYHFMTDMTDRAIGYVRTQKSLAPDKPFFMYFAPGATHAPHHAPKEWIAKFKGKFDAGWDVMREETLARQKQLGIVPPDTKLAPKPKDIVDWATLNPEHKRLFSRQMEVFAAYASFADSEIGRLITAVQDLGALDNTIVYYIMGDNGASGEGRMHGLFNEYSIVNGVDEPIELQLKQMDELGGPKGNNHYAAGWAVAGDAPFTWVKQVAANFGGTRNGLVVHWPKGIKARGEIRTQFHDVIDVAPTILEKSRPASADRGQRLQAASHRGREHELFLRRRKGSGAPYHAILRDQRQPRHLPRRLVRRDRASDPLDHQDLPRPADGGQVGALRRQCRLLPDQRSRGIEPGKAEGDAGRLHGGGDEIPRAAHRRPLCRTLQPEDRRPSGVIPE
jgi:arylsulfatase A-like enzyme